ncbi:hypothetical protein MHK_000085, partial [Candidatus Magnetomorum sp. HK-1]
GFTQDDVDKILEDYNLSDKREEVKEWYDGYMFGNVEIYNPWSILMYVNSRGKEGFQTYWANTSDNGLIKKAIKNAEEKASINLVRIINKEEVKKNINEYVVFESMYKESGIWSFLVAAGYLRSEKIKDREYKLSVPNREVQELYETLIQEWIEPTEY